MTTHFELTNIATKKKRRPMSPEELEKAKERAAHARKFVNVNAKKDSSNGLVVALQAKIASLEHQAVQYRTVIDYLESKVDSLLSRK